jgi:hypothetical protein
MSTFGYSCDRQQLHLSYVLWGRGLGDGGWDTDEGMVNDVCLTVCSGWLDGGTSCSKIAEAEAAVSVNEKK